MVNDTKHDGVNIISYMLQLFCLLIAITVSIISLVFFLPFNRAFLIPEDRTWDVMLNKLKLQLQLQISSTRRTVIIHCMRISFSHCPEKVSISVTVECGRLFHSHVIMEIKSSNSFVLNQSWTKIQLILPPPWLGIQYLCLQVTL